MSNVWVGVISVCIAAISVASTIVLEVRRRAESRNAERAKTAAELARILQELGTAGLDQGLDTTTAMARHQNQMRQLHIAVRKNTAEYARKAMRQGLSGATLAICAVVGTALLVYVFVVAPTVERIRVEERWVGVLLVLFAGALAFAMLVAAYGGWINRLDRDARTKDAGVQVARWYEDVLVVPTAIRIIRVRLTRRKELKALKHLGTGHERPPRGVIASEQ